MLRNATPDDVAYVLANLRAEDHEEIEAVTGLRAADAIANLDSTPNVTITLRRGGRPVAIFGAMLVGNGTAIMFRFATPRWAKAVREAIRFGRRQFLPRMWAAGVKRLEAVTLDVPAQTAWLRLFGAEETEKFYRNGCAFVRFAVHRPS